MERVRDARAIRVAAIGCDTNPPRARARSPHLPLRGRQRSMRARQSREPRTQLISTSWYSRHYCADEPGLRVFGSPRVLGLSTANHRPLQARAGVGGKQIFRSCLCVASERSHQSSHTSLRSLGALLWRPRRAFASPGAAYPGRAVANRRDHSPLPSWTSLLETGGTRGEFPVLEHASRSALFWRSLPLSEFQHKYRCLDQSEPELAIASAR
jgi:hypothetical protein